MSYYPQPPGTTPPWPPPPPNQDRLPGSEIGWLVAISCCIPVLGPIIALIRGFAQFRKSGAIAVILVGGFMLLLNLVNIAMVFFVSLPSFRHVKDLAKAAEAKAYLHELQLSVEQYAADHNGSYPKQMEETFTGGFLDRMPVNPFDNQQMREVDFHSPHNPGDYTYIVSSDVSGEKHYYLILYGAPPPQQSAADRMLGMPETDRRESYDLDGDGTDDNVLLVLSNDDNCTQNLMTYLQSHP